MESIHFYKMSGSGNDFIVIDNRERVLADVDLAGFIKNVCRRKLSVGADGLILIEKSEEMDFQWRFYNSDGSRAEMCGNGARCAARFAFLNGIAGPELVFGTDAGPIRAMVMKAQVKIRMPEPYDYQPMVSLQINGDRINLSTINTGVPHAVIAVDDIEGVDVIGIGRKVREHAEFAPAGTNVNFIAPEKGSSLSIRTYERGVEDETLACGTGSVAGALVHALNTRATSPIDLITRSGSRLTIHYKIDGKICSAVDMEGDARVIYSGTLTPDAWRY